MPPPSTQAYLVPNVIEQTSRGERYSDLACALLLLRTSSSSRHPRSTTLL